MKRLAMRVKSIWKALLKIKMKFKNTKELNCFKKECQVSDF
jgi:hypothetical protein